MNILSSLTGQIRRRPARHSDVGTGRDRRRAGGCDDAGGLFPHRATGPGATCSGMASATLAAVGLFAFVAYDMHHAALAYLGLNPSKPAVEFEIRLPRDILAAVTDTQIELHTDRNQTLAQVQGVRRPCRRPQRCCRARWRSTTAPRTACWS